MHPPRGGGQRGKTHGRPPFSPEVAAPGGVRGRRRRGGYSARRGGRSNAMMRLVQLSHPSRGRRVAVADEPNLRLLPDATSVYAFARAAIAAGVRLENLITDHL